MLSKASEKFLREFYIEMMARGKDDDAVEEMSAELEDHLIQAEKDGKTIEQVTGGSVKEYIKNISREMPTTNHIKKWIALFIIYLIGIMTIPSLIGGRFDWTLSQLLCDLLIIILGPAALYSVFKTVFVNYTDSKTKKIDRAGYVIIFSFSLLYMAILVGGLYLARQFPLVEIFNLQNRTNMIIGLVLLAVLIVGTLIMKQYFFSLLALGLALPEIIAQIFVGGSPESTQYNLVSTVTLFIVVAIILIGLLISNNINKKKSNN